MELKVGEAFDKATSAVTEVPKIWRAIFLGLTALLTGLAVVTVGDAGLTDINTSQVIVIAGSVLAAFGGVYGLSKD